MIKYLLDTNIISESRKLLPNSQVIRFLQDVDPQNLYISCLTVGEIQKGIAKRRKTDLVAAISLEKWRDTLLRRYFGNIIGIDSKIAKCWGELLAIDSTNVIDSLIGAQAIISDMTLVTRNAKHFVGLELKLINPFEEIL